MLKGKLIKLEKMDEIQEKANLLRSNQYQFLLVKFPRMLDFYVVFLKSNVAMCTSMTMHNMDREWSKLNIIEECHSYRNIITEGDQKETIKALKEAWGDVEVEEDPAIVIQMPKK